MKGDTSGLGLHQLTGSAAWDGVGSILIGVLLTAVALVLGRINLVGDSNDPSGRPVRCGVRLPVAE
ncbi:hypothetical protein ABZ801_03240 [Actinomadura sp. NPDC047616]|uniref:hypothetical protein n=1 Tax=Actinomadura sp. NPDC047616 TaxID=3155914 RepID=UPI0033EF7379